MFFVMFYVANLYMCVNLLNKRYLSLSHYCLLYYHELTVSENYVSTHVKRNKMFMRFPSYCMLHQHDNRHVMIFQPSFEKWHSHMQASFFLRQKFLIRLGFDAENIPPLCIRAQFREYSSLYHGFQLRFRQNPSDITEV